MLYFLNPSPEMTTCSTFFVCNHWKVYWFGEGFQTTLEYPFVSLEGNSEKGGQNYSLLGGCWAISKSSKSAVVSRIHLKAPQQQLKFLQFDFKEARTTSPRNAKKAPDRVSQKGELNSLYQGIFTYVSPFLYQLQIAQMRLVSWTPDYQIDLGDE